METFRRSKRSVTCWVARMVRFLSFRDQASRRWHFQFWDSWTGWTSWKRWVWNTNFDRAHFVGGQEIQKKIHTCVKDGTEKHQSTLGCIWRDFGSRIFAINFLVMPAGRVVWGLKKRNHCEIRSHCKDRPLGLEIHRSIDGLMWKNMSVDRSLGTTEQVKSYLLWTVMRDRSHGNRIFQSRNMMKHPSFAMIKRRLAEDLKTSSASVPRILSIRLYVCWHRLWLLTCAQKAMKFWRSTSDPEKLENIVVLSVVGQPNRSHPNVLVWNIVKSLGSILQWTVNDLSLGYEECEGDEIPDASDAPDQPSTNGLKTLSSRVLSLSAVERTWFQRISLATVTGSVTYHCTSSSNWEGFID